MRLGKLLIISFIMKEWSPEWSTNFQKTTVKRPLCKNSWKLEAVSHDKEELDVERVKLQIKKFDGFLARWKHASRELLGTLRFSERVCISCFISALRPITSFVRWHLHVNGKSARGGYGGRASINQKANLKKGQQPARCVTTPKSCRTANSQECRYFEKIVSSTEARLRFFGIGTSRLYLASLSFLIISALFNSFKCIDARASKPYLPLVGGFRWFTSSCKSEVSSRIYRWNFSLRVSSSRPLRLFRKVVTIRETIDSIPFRYVSVAIGPGYNFRQVGPLKWRHGERCKTKRFLPHLWRARETSIISSRYFCHEGTRWTRWHRAMFNTFPVGAPRVWRFCLMHNAHASSLCWQRF